VLSTKGMHKTLLVLTLGTSGACGNSAASPPDAAVGTDGLSSFYCPAPIDPTVPGKLKVFVNTEGVTLTKGDCDDSRTNCTNLIQTDQSVVPPFMDGDTQRETVIATNIAVAQQILSAYSVDFVRTRPTTGDYEMLVLGGSSTDLVGIDNLGSLAPGSCTNQHRDSIGLEFDFGVTEDFYAYHFVSDLGSIIGLGASDQKDDCMCRVDSVCAATADTCTFGMVPASTQFNCGRAGIVDEPALLKAFLGCR
jgi:hypothetical protein